MEATDCKTPGDVLNLIKEKNVDIIDYKFMDFPGLWKHFSVPATELEGDTFNDGIGFDG